MLRPGKMDETDLKAIGRGAVPRPSDGLMEDA
jgi:hypothetical protein